MNWAPGLTVAMNERLANGSWLMVFREGPTFTALVFRGEALVASREVNAQAGKEILCYVPADNAKVHVAVLMVSWRDSLGVPFVKGGALFLYEERLLAEPKEASPARTRKKKPERPAMFDPASGKRLGRRLTGLVLGMAEGKRYGKGQAPYITASEVKTLGELGFRVSRGQVKPFGPIVHYAASLEEWKARAQELGLKL